MKNLYLRDFREQLRLRFAEDRESMSYSDWIVANTKMKKKPFSFVGYEFQKAIVDDMSPTMNVVKCSQIGLTEVQLRKNAAFLARNTGVNTIFTLPTDVMFKRVSQTRFAPLLIEQPVFNLAAEKTPIRSMGIYQINQSYGYFVGNKEGDATSINADMLFHDELDLSDMEMIALFQSRLQGSDWRITQSFSTPTFENFGIDAGYNLSDQHEYLCRCPHCRHYNIPEFTPAFVSLPGFTSDHNDLTEITEEDMYGFDLRTAYLRCEKCGKPLDLKDPTLRSWVPRFPGRRIRGYRCPPFVTSRLTVGYIFEQLFQYKERNSLRRFHNTVLGQAKTDANARLTEPDIRKVMRGASEPTVDSTVPVALGIDVGHTCHIVLLRLDRPKPVPFSFRTVLSENLKTTVQFILDQYNVITGAMDRNPYTPLANEIRDLSQGRILPVEYATTDYAAVVQLVYDEVKQISHVRANRTALLDEVASLVRGQMTEFYGYAQYENTVVEHLQAMARIENEDTPARWLKLSRQDHFFHTLGYGFYSTRLKDAVDFRDDSEQRQLVLAATAEVQNDSGLGMKSRQSTLMSLGTL